MVEQLLFVYSPVLVTIGTLVNQVSKGPSGSCVAKKSTLVTCFSSFLSTVESVMTYRPIYEKSLVNAKLGSSSVPFSGRLSIESSTD